MNPLKPVRDALRPLLIQIAETTPEIISLSVVGSFNRSDSLDAVADIDVVIVVNELRSAEFETLIERFTRITGEEIALPHHVVRVNPTFGPLKFDDPETVVFHVMVYDLDGHRDHVIKSPFTCLDWEQNLSIYGPSLTELYSASGVQPRDIVASRRGIDSYLADLAAGEISYREYDLSVTPPKQVGRSLALDQRHTVEFAYHVLRNLFLNTLKVLTGQNIAGEGEQLVTMLGEYLPLSAEDGAFFLNLYRWKRDGAPMPEDAVAETNRVVYRLQKEVEVLFNAAPQVIFLRHGRTPANDGSFLGVGRDPEIVPVDSFSPEEGAFRDELKGLKHDSRYTVWSSPLLRSRQTAALVADPDRVNIDERLREIDYGRAEGLTYNELLVRFPEIPRGWTGGEDPPFPEGESQHAVDARLQAFISDRLVPSGRAAIVVTHNVVLRTLLGGVFNAPIDRWYLLQPRHLEPLTFRLINGRLVPDLTDSQRTRFRDQLASTTFQSVGYTPGESE